MTLKASNLKIAVAMFGIPRCTRVCAPSIETNILAPLREMGEVSVHYHLYQQTQVINPRSGENGQLGDDNYEYFKQFHGRLADPEEPFVGQALDRWKSFGDAFDDGFNSLRNLRSQLYSLLQVTSFVERDSPDVVAFIRPDLCYHTPLNARAIDYLARHPNACILPNWQWWGGYNDRFALCGAESYWAYGARIHRALPFCKEIQGPLHSERLVRYALKNNRCVVRVADMKASRVRINGEIREENFDSNKTLYGGRRLKLEQKIIHLMSKIEALYF